MKSGVFRAGFEALNKDEKALAKMMFDNGQKKIHEIIDKYKSKK
jgi:hypothetical protein